MPVICQVFEQREEIGRADAVRRLAPGVRVPAQTRRPALGVLVCERDAPDSFAGEPFAGEPFAEADFIRRLQEAGDRLGLEVFALAPWTADAASRTAFGWRWDAGAGAWRRARVPIPALLYDRAWPGGDEERRRFRIALHRLLDGDHPPRLLNAHLPGKAAVHAMLSRHPAIRAHLPPTHPYTGQDGLRDRLERWGGAAFLKPVDGWQGRGVMAVRRRPDGLLELAGRTRRNDPFRLEAREEMAALERVDRWIGAHPYLMQPFLELNTPEGDPFDLRLLVQKNSTGRWALTGAAVRLGLAGGVTANLHGGGIPLPPETTLARWFGENAARELMRTARRLAADIVRQLESSFGRFAELGLDFGIDRTGKLWFLEANGKPGRAAARRAGRRADALSHLRPLMYARSILLRLSREGHP